jgi:hypothetical protein
LDLRAKENQKRDWNIEILRRLGWTQKEIGKGLEISQQRIAEIVPVLSQSLKPVKTQLAKTHQIESVAEAWGFHSPRSG